MSQLDKEYQTEFPDELQHFGVDNVAEMTHEDAHEEHECDAERNTANLELTEEHTGRNDKRVEHERARQRFVAGAEQTR